MEFWKQTTPDDATTASFPFLLQKRREFRINYMAGGSVDDLKAGALLRKSTPRTAYCNWPKNTFAVHTGYGVADTSIHLDFGSGIGNARDNYTVSLTVEFIKLNFELVDSPTDFVSVVATASDNQFEYRLSDIIARHNRYAWMVARGYVDRRRQNDKKSRNKKFSDLTLAVSTMMFNFANLSTEREYERAYAAGPYEDIRTAHELKQIMIASLKRGQAIFTPNMCWATATNVWSNVDSDSDEEDAGEGMDLSKQADVASAIDSGVFPYTSSFKLSTTSISYKHTLAHAHNKVDADMKYAAWNHKTSLAEWGTQVECQALLGTDWVPLNKDRDFLSRYINNEGVSMQTGLWSYCGTRAHRKCYARTLLGKFDQVDDGIDYTHNEFDSHNDELAPTHKMENVVLAENGYMHIHAPGPRNRIDWYEINEGVTSDMMKKSVYSRRAAPDTALIEHFASNLRKLNKAVCTRDYTGSVEEAAAEFSVYWPFGMHSKNEHDAGRAYETRADLVMWGTDTDGKRNAFLVEYKTRMEVSSNVKDIYLLKTTTSDRLQLRLNAWMIYLDTGVFLPHAYVIQASRRNTDDGDTEAPSGVAVRLDTPRASPEMVKLITTFAIHPYGPLSVARYVDDQFIIPDLTKLMTGLGIQTGKALTFEDDTGRNAIFSQILMSSKFSKAIDTAIDSSRACDASPVVHLGLPDSCFAPGKHGIATAKVSIAFQENATKPIGVNTLLTQLQNKWTTHQEWSGAHAVMAEAGFLPVLFNGDGNALLYISNAFTLRVYRTQFKDKLSPIASGSAFASLSSLPLFRGTADGAAQVKFNHRLRFGNDTQPPPLAMICERLRTQLAKSSTLAAGHIDHQLQLTIGELQLERVDGADFWEMTIDSIFRRHILHPSQVSQSFPGKGTSPCVREFARIINEPYAPPPKQIAELATLNPTHTHNTRRPSREYRQKLKQLRMVALCRCVHRLVNTRLLRGSLALVGVSHTLYEQLDNQHQWTERELTQWQTLEQQALHNAMAANTDAPGHESKDWWQATGKHSTGREDMYQRQDIFPHMSQRAMWSRAALEAATGMMLANSDGQGQGATVVELARDHILENLIDACKTHLEEDQND